MKVLKGFLIGVYVIIFLILLLGLIRCEKEKEAVEDDEEVVIKESFNAEIVLCIDCTGSMDGIMATIKDNAMNLYADIKKKCVEQGKEVVSMRIKVIAFRDICDTPTFESSHFYSMPSQEELFKSYVSNLKILHGGDTPERGYDALSMAILSDWDSNPEVRKMIILWTDAPSHPLTGRTGTRNFEELTEMWNTKFEADNKRLLLFAPDDDSWTRIEHNWSHTTRHDVGTGGGLSELDYEEILRALSESI